MYERRVDRNTPSCLVFMVDQSASMSFAMTGSAVSRAATVADQLNGLLYELIQRCTKSLNELPRPYFAVAVVGYRTDGDGRPIIGSLLGGALAERPWVWTTDLAQHPLRLEERQQTGSAGVQRYRVPVWVDPLATGGTPLCAAMNHVGRLVRGWVDQYPNSFPPIIINLSDGESTDGDPVEWARRLTSLSTTDGGTLMFNLDVSGTGTPVLFPDQEPLGIGEYGRTLFAMSSPLPPVMLSAAAAQGFPVRPGVRGFGLNADLRSVVTFLNVGTGVSHLLR
jgi:hypothetical protein